MTKTKRQLRAEAVERLRDTHNILNLSELWSSLFPVWYSMNERAIRDALIDLLTDDEPPEDDAVAIMRKAAKGFSGGTGNVMENAKMLLGMNVKSSMNSVVFYNLADMIERDYVRRDSLTDDEAANCKNPDSLSLTTEDEAANCKKPESLQDSRAKLEEDVRHFANYWAYDDYLSDETVEEMRVECMSKLRELLDRQVAITRADCERESNAAIESWRERNGCNMEIADSLAKRNAELEAALEKAMKLRDAWIDKLDRRNNEYIKKKKEFDELKAENAELREKLGRDGTCDHS